MEREETPTATLDESPRVFRAHEHSSAPENGNGHGHEDAIDLDIPKPGSAWVVLAAIGVTTVLAALLVIGLLPRREAANQLAADAANAANAPVMVNVAHPTRGPTEVKVALPGTLRPWQEVSIFARTTGYLKKYYVDISNDVKAGQLIAEIDTPEVDQELGQSEAALLQAKAAVTKSTTDRDLAKVTYDRYVSLKETHSVSLQDLDEKKSALDAAVASLESANANAAAAEANVRRLKQMQDFEKVNAPFSGVVTGRAYDVGSMIVGNPTATDIKPMFKIAENDVLRAFVNVPQSSALAIKKGMDVTVSVRERPGRTYSGKVMGTTNYLDPTNRSLLTEVKIPNPKESDGTFSLLPGMYIQATFTVSRDTPPLVIPAPALVNNAEGTQVAIVRNGLAHFQKVTLGQDYGTTVEVVAGLNGDEQIIANPGERIAEGVAVSTGTEAGETPARESRVKVSEATK
jgi:RND family efflux transporter MFP subunit